jgi:hypothetical protein
LFIVVLLLAILAASPSQSDAAPRLVLTTSLPITELSFDDGRLAWVQYAPHPASRESVESYVHRANDEEGSAEEHTLVLEDTRNHERGDEHRNERDEQRGTDDALLGVDGIR